jgi:hypothetical protein
MAKGKKQRAMKQLRHAYLGLRAAKVAAAKADEDPEYEELVQIAKRVFFEAHCLCLDSGVDPIPICINLGKRR